MRTSKIGIAVLIYLGIVDFVMLIERQFPCLQANFNAKNSALVPKRL